MLLNQLSNNLGSSLLFDSSLEQQIVNLTYNELV